jgi:hypothetical protein
VADQSIVIEVTRATTVIGMVLLLAQTVKSVELRYKMVKWVSYLVLVLLTELKLVVVILLVTAARPRGY